MLVIEKLEKIWKDWEAFASYAFNKSHSTCYAWIAYQTAYLKAHYPAAFMAALMTSDFDDTDRLAIQIAECRHMGIEVLPPDVNESFVEFAVVPRKKQIRFGMAAVKNVGTGAVEEVLRARNDGAFTSIEDFVTRVSTRVVNRKAWESLVKAGAFDRFGSRADLLFNLDKILAFGSKKQKDIASGQTDLFGGAVDSSTAPALQIDQAPQMEQREYLQWERELLGIYLSSHPLKEYEKILQKLNPIGDIKPNLHDSKVTIGGSISKINSIVTKAGKKMAFVTVEDLSSEIELLVFPRVFEEYEELITQDAVVIVEGTVNSTDRDGRRTDDVKVFVDTLELARKNMKLEKREIRQKTNYKPVEKPLRVPAVKKEPKLYIHIKDPENSDALIALKKTLGGSPGVVVTVLVVGEGDKKQAIKLPFKVAVTNELKTELVDLLGEGCVVEK